VESLSLPAAVAAALDRFRGALGRRFGARLREVILFGSYARGDAHEGSDVDVLVVVEGLTEGERRDVMDYAYDAAAHGDADDWVSISPIPYSAAQVAELRARERRLVRDADAEGIRL
jgi:predicted nucleotidyltransferase